MNLGRGTAAVFIGVMLIVVMHGILEQNLVRAIADEPLTDAAAFAAVRNRPAVLVLTLVSLVFTSTLAGYILAKIAGANEVRYAIAAAVAMTVVYAYGFTIESALVPPLWVRVAMLIVTPPTLIAGASIRAQARSIQQEAAVPRPEERS